MLATPLVLARYRFTTAREVEQGAIACPHRTALIDDSGSLTYSQLQTNARIFAAYLRDTMNGNIHMGVMARNGRGIIYPMAAKGFAGATIYLQNIGSSKEQLTNCLKRDGVVAFKAIENNKQVALIVPTTVLAEQHYKRFCQRFSHRRSEERRVGKECRSRWSPYH